MAADRLQEAITLIRAGDRQSGQKLLTEILNAEPRNETAWLWMSALMSGEKRRFCLEKVLSINPDHQQAREQLAKLAASTSPAPEPTIPTTVSARVLVSPVPPAPEGRPTPVPEPQNETVQAAVSAPVQGTPLPKVWLIPGMYSSNIIYLEGNNLLAFDVPPGKASEVLEDVRLGVTQKQFEALKNKFQLTNVNHILLSKISSVTLSGSTLKIVGTDKSGKEKKLNAKVNKENSEAVLKALQERLGPDFQRSARPVSGLTGAMSGLLGKPPEEIVLARESGAKKNS